VITVKVKIKGLVNEHQVAADVEEGNSYGPWTRPYVGYLCTNKSGLRCIDIVHTSRLSVNK
jgi:hypothetical protein